MRSDLHKSAGELNTGSTADIAFLLLSFFLMTTVIPNEKGLTILLPELRSDMPVKDVHSRNLFKIQINSHDQFMVNDQVRPDLSGLKAEIKTFLLNYNSDPTLSVSPKEAIVSLKADRGTTHKIFIAALDEIQGAYYDIYAQRVGISVEKFRKLDLQIPEENLLFSRAREGFPMNISIAEPSRAINELQPD